MNPAAFQHLICPLDGTPLTSDGGAWRCGQQHCFDIAREGYVNLLPVQNKRSLQPGDSKEMVAARKRFLNHGHYAPIAETLNRYVVEDLQSEQQLSCLDAGCGEGYYLRQTERALVERAHSSELLGLDISKFAVSAASKQFKGAQWVVGSNANLPVAAGCIDRLFCVFGFPVYPEFARVLKPGGQLLQVDPGPDHLRELREIIYPRLAEQSDRKPKVIPGFNAPDETQIKYTIQLTSADQISDLLAMTPHLFRMNAEGKAKAAALTSVSITVDAHLSRYERAQY